MALSGGQCVETCSSASCADLGYTLKAPGEAEAELAYLNRIGVIDAVISDDVDNFLFGSTVVIRK